VHTARSADRVTTESIPCLATSASNSCQRSRLSTGSPLALRHSRRCQRSIQLSLTARTTYWESPSTETRQGCSFSARSPSIAARNSIRELVVYFSLRELFLGVLVDEDGGPLAGALVARTRSVDVEHHLLQAGRAYDRGGVSDRLVPLKAVSRTSVP
jgi:hypothetical protein